MSVFDIEKRIAIVISHPIQHFCPQYASYAKVQSLRVKVFFGSKQGVKPYVDKNFKKSISWNKLYLEEFDHEFLNGEDVLPSNMQLDAANLDNKLNEFCPDFLIIYGYVQKLQRRAYNWAVRRNVKILYVSDSELLQKRPFGLSLIKKAFIVRYFKKISGFLTVGDSNEFFYKYNGVPFNKMFRTFFPIDEKTFQSILIDQQKNKGSIKKKYSLEDNDFIISTVGKLMPFKHQIDVILAMKELEMIKEKRIIYLVIGDGEQREKLEKAARNLSFHKVIFTGFTQPEDLPFYYVASDLYVHPAKIEPHSLAISEAIYCGCPILISNRCGSYGPTDDVQSGVNGLVYEFNNIKELAKKIKYFIDNPLIRNDFSRNSNSMALQHQKLAHGNGILNAISSLND